MNTTNGYNLALQRQLVDSKINDISDLKQKLEFSKIGSASDGMSVTSTVEECEKHGKYTSYEKYLTISGKRITSSKSECPQCLEEKIRKKEIEREQAEQRARQSKIEYLLNSLNIPERFKNCTLQNYEPVNDDAKRVLRVCQAYASKWPERLQKGGGLVMCGKPGTGKNHLALAIARHAIIEHQSSVIFTTALKIAREYKSTWSKAATRTEEVIRQFTHPDLLIIDEVGVQFGSDAEKLIMFEIINTRYEYMKPTILISNQSKDELSAFIGERVIDRMNDGGGCTLAFTWDSYRSRS
ncbi:ATP-binding protein [Escherichia coli]